MQISALIQPILLLSSLLMTVPACGLMNAQLIVYDQQGIRIAIEKDPTVSRASPPAYNNHPAELSAENIQGLLEVIQVSGWSGTLVGMVATPRPVPLFTDKQLAAISGHIASAFKQAAPTERVYFSLPKPDVSYSEDRTEGSLFLRGRYLHVVVTDHVSVIRADTGGGDSKDIRDTKGMKLWIAGPAQAATVPDAEEPRWAAFETVHVSLNLKEVLALHNQAHRVVVGGEGVVSSPPSRKLEQHGASQENLQLQVRELTSSNLELRGRLDEQNKRMQALTEELEQLRVELDRSKPKRTPSRKVPAQ